MKDTVKGVIFIAILLMIIWGIEGLTKGYGFLGGIKKQIDAIGEIISTLIKIGLVVGVIWFIIEIFKDLGVKK